jgi:hypothetical protein
MKCVIDKLLTTLRSGITVRKLKVELVNVMVRDQHCRPCISKVELKLSLRPLHLSTTVVFGERPGELRVMFPTEDESQWEGQHVQNYLVIRNLVYRGDNESAVACTPAPASLPFSGSLTMVTPRRR